MSASLMILIPVILLGIVGMLCFVGCILPVKGLGPDFTSYTNTMRANSDCIAYWPLKEDADTKPAAELISGSNGKYIDQTTVVPPNTVYPWPQYNVANGPTMVLSAAAANPADPANPDKGGLGDIKFAQETIVRGDVDPLPNDPAPPACMVVNGCYVEVPWKFKFVPQTTFTVEAWVRVDWTAADPHAWRFVLDMREQTPITTGFAIYAEADDNAPGMYRWAAIIGDGSSKFRFLNNTEAPVTLKDPAGTGTVVYLTLTYNSGSQTLTLFVNGASVGQLTQVGYAPNAAQVLWIGAGSPYVPRRTQPADPNVLASPLFPFVGAIQDVAIYKTVLSDLAILTHFHNGQGKTS
jgi:hypothetical protein